MDMLESERVIVSSPMSFSGATRRIARAGRVFDGVSQTAVRAALKVALWLLVLGPILLAWWLVIVAWYVVAFTVFLPFTIIWRLFRRSNRRAKQRELQHREQMAAMSAIAAQQQRTPDATE